MKKIVVISIVIILLVLDWAALHDILKGEPNLFLEYGVLIFSGVVFLVVIGKRVRNKIKLNGK